MSVEQINKAGDSKQEADNKKQFELQRLYIKEQHCKISRSPQVFKDEWKPEVSMEMQINNVLLEPEHYEVTLQISITAKNNQITVFSAEVQQAGIFLVKGFAEEEQKMLLASYGPSMLYPYARQVMTKLSVDATIPPIMLVPVNFDAMYKQQQEQAKQQAKPAVKEAATLN